MNPRLGAVAAIAVSALLLSGCVGYETEVVEGSAVAVGWDQPFFSYNPASVYGAGPGNASISYATNSGFSYYDDSSRLVRDDSFGSYEKLSDDPLVVKYTIADGVRWSDGTAVDAADLLLNWAALSGAFNDPGFDRAAYVDPESGQLGDVPAGTVYFDSGADPGHPRGLGLVSEVPEVSADLKSITMTYDEPFADWELAFTSAGVPAHVVAGHALELDDVQQAKAAVVDAVTSDDEDSLAALSAFWNTGFSIEGMPDDPDLLIGNGPYRITDLVAGQYVTLTANPEYEGSRMPHIEQVVVRVIPDSLAAVQALYNRAVQVIVPQATEEVADALASSDMTVVSTASATYERIDLQFAESMSGAFADTRVREAFLKTIPRAEIVTTLVSGLQEDATTRDSHLFLPGADGYADSIAANGSADYAAVDIAGATALLAEAGVPNPQVCVLYPAGGERQVAEFALIQASAALAGIGVTDCSAENWRDQLGVPGAYDAALYGWQPTTVGVTTAIEMFGSGGRSNRNYYSNDEVDALLTTLSATFDPADQGELEQQVDALLWSDAYGMPLYQYPSLVAYDHDAIEPLSSTTLAPTIFWNVWDWKVVTP